MQPADPPLRAGERDLHGADRAQQHREDDVEPLEPRGDRQEEDEDLEPVGGEADGPVRVQGARSGAEDVRADQVDLREDRHDDRGREEQVQADRRAARGAERTAGARPAWRRDLDRRDVAHAPCTARAPCGSGVPAGSTASATPMRTKAIV